MSDETTSGVAQAAPPAPLTAKDIADLVHDRFPTDRGWKCMNEVEPPTAPGEKQRRFDVVCLGLWRSNAQEVQGFEVKVSRSDWLAERADPSKAELLMRWCDRYWLVCTPDVAPVDEVPATWGVLYATPNGLRQKRAAPRLTPCARGADFWCTMINRLIARLPRADADLQAARHAGWEDGYKKGQELSTWEAGHTKKQFDALRAEVDAFEAASGVAISHGWHQGREIGEALKALMSMPIERLVQRIEGAAKYARETADSIDNVATRVRALLEKTEDA